MEATTSTAEETKGAADATAASGAAAAAATDDTPDERTMSEIMGTHRTPSQLMETSK